METLAYQTELRPELPNVYGTLDYHEFRQTLIKIDEILLKSDLEHGLVTQALAEHIKDQKLDAEKFYASKRINLQYKKFRHALRCNIARHLVGESYRLFSIRLADSHLFQWFTGINDFGTRKAISKSSLERYEKYYNEQLVAQKIREWLAGLSNIDKALTSGLNQPIDFSSVFMDSTCIKSHIHFPVDWVLLRDAARSLLLAITTIRSQGLKHRMIEPKQLLKQMNILCIKMTHTRRKKDGKKQRKTILRVMKKLVQCIAKHANRYRDMLTQERGETDWTDAQSNQVIARIDLIVEQLPAAIKQAHERIIGERIVPSADKIISLYDKDAHVIVRGKAGGEVEFGQSLLLSEQQDGLIIDWELFGGKTPSDSKLLEPTINRIKNYYGQPNSVCGDRGFSSKKTDEFLDRKKIINGICPKGVSQLQERLKDSVFVSLQTRRSQTEARIGIFKNIFLGKPLRSRITLNKRHAINWCVLTHNLWVLARKSIAEEKLPLKHAA